VKGGRKKSTWPKGKKPPVQRPKGSKNKKTLLKESLGLKNWDKLVSFVNNEAAEKLVDEIYKLNGKDYIYALIDGC
jgi:hypothetical protein